MYVIPQHIGDTIKIGDDITLTVIDFHPHINQITLGIHVPNEITVQPGERFTYTY